MSAEDLTDKQRQFCHEYLLDFNATQAAIRAGYAPDHAHTEGSRLLRNVKVKAYIDELSKERQKAYSIAESDILNYYRNAATLDPLEVFNEYGDLKNLSEIPPQYRILIKTIETKKEGVKVTFFDKEVALSKLERHLGMSTAVAKSEVKVEGDLTNVPIDQLEQLADELAERLKK